MLPTGSFDTDWIAIASNLLSLVVRGKLLLKVVDNYFFRPLAYSKDVVESIGVIDPGVTLGKSLSAGLNGVPRRLLSDSDGGRDSQSSIKGTVDVFTRLLLVADMLSSKLRQFVKIDIDISMEIDDSKEDFFFKSFCDLTGKSYDIIHNFARRQEEEVLEDICGQAVTLCIGVLSLIEDRIVEDIVISSEGNSVKASDHFVRRYVEEIPYPPGSKRWSPLLLKLLNDMPLLRLPSAVKCLAKAGVNGVICCDQSLSSELSDEKNEKLKKLQEDLIREVQRGVHDTSITVQLQNISSILNDNVDYFLNDSENKYLMDIPTISNYLKNHANPVVKGIFTQLKVKHYGACLLYLRQTIGLLSYHNLRSKTYLNDISCKDDNVIGYFDGENCLEESRIVNSIKIKATVYHERVPEDWEYLQNKSTDNPEDVKSTGELLSNGLEMAIDEHTYENEDDVDQICPVFNGSNDFNHMDISSPLVAFRKDGGEVRDMREECYRRDKEIPVRSGAYIY